mgnify:CR=1 FL=1
MVLDSTFGCALDLCFDLLGPLFDRIPDNALCFGARRVIHDAAARVAALLLRRATRYLTGFAQHGDQN